jgi:hypothetical protein
MNLPYVILDQKSQGECAFYSVLACLMRMKRVDPIEILEEAQEDFGRILSIKQAGAWFKRKGYIKDFVPYRYNPTTVDHTPVV